MISLISAIGKNNELGKDNALLWDLPADMKHFRDTTRGHTVIMGRKTFESIGRPLPERKNIIITRDENYSSQGIEIAHSLEEALQKAGNEEEAFVIGGAEIYKQALPFADRLYITEVASEFKDADAFFPDFNKEEWKVISEEQHVKDDHHLYDFVFKIYERAK